MVNYEIRDACVEDYAEIDKLAVEAWQVLIDGYDPKQWGKMLLTIGNMSSLAAKGQMIVAADNTSIYGAVCYMPAKTSTLDYFPSTWPSIRMLATRPAYQKIGIGRRLMEECVHRAKLDQADCIGLHTSPIMTVALPLYQSMGFIKDKDLSSIAGAPYERFVLKF